MTKMQKASRNWCHWRNKGVLSSKVVFVESTAEDDALLALGGFPANGEACSRRAALRASSPRLAMGNGVDPKQKWGRSRGESISAFSSKHTKRMRAHKPTHGLAESVLSEARECIFLKPISLLILALWIGRGRVSSEPRRSRNKSSSTNF